MTKRVHNAILGTAFAAVTGATAAQVPTTIEYIGEATVFVSGTTPSAAPGVGREDPMGHEVVAGASRTIDLTGRRKAVNVTAGEVVQFKLDDRSVTWDFDTLGTPTFVLSRIIPGAPAVRVYVAPDPMNGGS